MSLKEETPEENVPSHIELKRVLQDGAEQAFQFAEDVWPVKTSAGEYGIIDFSAFNVRKNMVVAAKELFLTFCKVDVDGTLVSSYWAKYRVRRIITILDQCMETAGVDRVSDLQVEHIEGMLTRSLMGQYDEGQSIAYTTYETMITTLSKFKEGFLNRAIEDGPIAMPSPSHCYSLAREALENSGRDYAEWVSGSKLDGLPMSLLMVLLSEAISIIHSDLTKYLLAFFQYQKDIISQGFPLTNGCRSNRGVYFTPQKVNRIYKLFLSERTANYPKTVDHMYVALPEYCARECQVESVSELPFKKWPFQTVRDISRHLQRVYAAGFIIISCVTGARRNELETLRVSDLLREKDGSYSFRSDINKTNHGIPTIRSITGLAADVVGVLERLSLEDKTTNDLPLFWAPQGMSLQTSGQPFQFACSTNLAAEQNARHILRRYINKDFLSEFPGLSSELEFIKVTPHRFRHAFAEFALRRFDGNVPDLIRRHFRHNYSSFMTTTYTSDKLYVSETYSPEKMALNYLSELGLNWLDNKEQLYGPVGMLIKQKLKTLNFLAPDELEKELAAWCEEEFTGELKSMEYGFCVFRRKTGKQANCRDVITGVPVFENSSVCTCTGCVHSLSIGSQREDIIRIGQSVKSQLNSYQKMGITSLVQACEKELKYAEALIRTVSVSDV